MQRLLTFILLAIGPSLSCSLSRTFVFPTIEESSKLSGAVLSGTVASHEKTRAFMPSTITLESVTYHKGCGPSTVTIEGYSSGTLCGISAPKIGKKIIAFVCKSEEDADWKLHKFTAYAGQFVFNDENLKEVQRVNGENECQGAFRFEECSKERLIKERQFELKVEYEPKIRIESDLVVDSREEREDDKR